MSSVAEKITIKFGFDPFTSEVTGPLVSDPIAFTLWAMWKRNHIVSTGFILEVRRVAEVVKKRHPKTVRELTDCFPFMSDDFNKSDAKVFAPEWLSVLHGNTVVEVEYQGKRVEIKFLTSGDVQAG